MIKRYESESDIKDYYYLQWVKNEYCTAHFHKGYEFVYIANGNHNININGFSRTLGPDEIVVVRSFEMHHYHFQNFSEIYVFLVNEEYMNDFKELYKDKFFDNFLCDREFNRQVLKIIEELYPHKENLSKLAIKGYLNLILDKLLKRYEIKPVKNNSDHLIIRILNYIDENYMQNISLEDIAREFSYSKYYLSRMFNQYIGLNLKSYINSLRMQKVKLMQQRNQDLKLTNLALEVGFNSVRTFYRTRSKH